MKGYCDGVTKEKKPCCRQAQVGVSTGKNYCALHLQQFLDEVQDEKKD